MIHDRIKLRIYFLALFHFPNRRKAAEKKKFLQWERKSKNIILKLAKSTRPEIKQHIFHEIKVSQQG